MRILIAGANGFIGSYITAALLKNNYEVICAVRDVDSTRKKFPTVEIIHCDLNKDLNPQDWLNRLNKVDIVINVSGILTSSNDNNIENVHIHGAKALFTACMLANIRRIIHISALGIDDEKSTAYALTKKATEEYLQKLENIDWVILQPSLVYASGCYGGTSLFRALATLPYFIPLIGNGLQQFQPIHINDLIKVVIHCIERKEKISRLLKVVGSEIVTMKDILVSFRRWLGIEPGKLIKIPRFFFKIAAKLGDCLKIKSINSTTYNMLLQHNTADKKDLIDFTSITPRKFQKGLITEPLTIQSLWHARLYLLKPIIKITLGLFWIMNGMIASIVTYDSIIQTIISLGFDKQTAPYILYGYCCTDIILGTLLIIKRKISYICNLQILLILADILLLAYLEPVLSGDLFSSILQNIPIILLTLVLMAIERDKL